MRLPSPRWLRIGFLATALVFGGVAVYLYGFRFFAWLESDAAVTGLLAAKALHARSPIVADWYYANGDVWGLAPHLFAILPVALLGLGPASLLVAVVSGFVLELVVLVQLYVRLGGERWIALWAAMVTLMAWSNAHVAYAYIQLAYGLMVCLYLLSFVWFAGIAAAARVRPASVAAAGLLIAVISVQNPDRGLAYLLAPLLAGCLWPWHGLAARRRLALAAAVSIGWLVAFGGYGWLVSRVVALSIPRGHVAFVIGGPGRIAANLGMLGRGLSLLCAGGSDPGARALPGALILVGALALVGREVLASRAFTALRFVSVSVSAQLGCVLVPLVVGNLLDGPEAIRYLMPSLVATFGLAVVIAVRTLCEAVRAWRRLATGWLIAVPLAALVAAPDARPPTPTRDIWPDAAGLADVADALVHRGLVHGFANNLAANLLTLDARGATLTCRIVFGNVIMPQRWLADTACFTAAALPERFYVVAYQGDRDRAAIEATLGPATERFRVGDTFEVHVYRTRDTSPAWLDLPLPEGALATFPLRLPATHLQLVRGKVAVQAGELVATGEPGTVLAGPDLELPKGRYTATWFGHGVESSGELTFGVTSRGRTVLARVARDAKQLATSSTGRVELARIAFTVDRSLNRIALPVESAGGGRVVLQDLVIEQQR